MKKTLSAVVGLALSGSVLAAGESTYFYPNADGVVVAGTKQASVCYWQDELDNVIYPEWTCDSIQLYGAKNPVMVLFNNTTPVRVQDARWAFALKDKKGRSHSRMVTETETEIGPYTETQESVATTGSRSWQKGDQFHDLGFDALSMEKD